MITINEITRGSGGSFLIAGSDHEAVRLKAEAIRKSIDFMRSPTIIETVQNTGELLCEVKYYGLD